MVIRQARSAATLVCALLTALLVAPTPKPISAQMEEKVISSLPPELAAQLPEEIRNQLPLLSGRAMLILARALGIEQIAGKSITAEGSATGPSERARQVWDDFPVLDHPTKHENEPTVAANPRNANHLVAGGHFFGPPAPFTNRCVATTSFDLGHTWSDPVLMPRLTPASSCSDPVLAYAPDGSRVHYAYMDIKAVVTQIPPAKIRVEQDLDIVVSRSDDGGDTWTGPVVALNGSPTVFEIDFGVCPTRFEFVERGFLFDKNWIGTHIDASQGNWVYVTATRFDNFAPFANHIAFTRSGDKGVTWGEPAILDTGGFSPGPPPVFRLVQGSRPTGGVGSEVLVAWYHSGDDGFLNGQFQIRTRRSGNNGATFDPIVVAAQDGFETPFWLGPFASLFRWWATMFPDVEIGSDGKAHIVYTHDPVANPFAVSTTAEDGDIRYITGYGPPYNSWSLPVTVNDDGEPRAQGFATVETSADGPRALIASFFDSRRSLHGNVTYEVFATQKVGNAPWQRPFPVSAGPSMSDFVFAGDYNDQTDRFVVWTDRRHLLDGALLQGEDNVFGSRVETPARR